MKQTAVMKRLLIILLAAASASAQALTQDELVKGSQSISGMLLGCYDTGSRADTLRQAINLKTINIFMLRAKPGEAWAVDSFAKGMRPHISEAMKHRRARDGWCAKVLTAAEATDKQLGRLLEQQEQFLLNGGSSANDK